MPSGNFFKDSYCASIGFNKFVDFTCTAGSKTDFLCCLLPCAISSGAYFQNFTFQQLFAERPGFIRRNIQFLFEFGDEKRFGHRELHRTEVLKKLQSGIIDCLFAFFPGGSEFRFAIQIIRRQSIVSVPDIVFVLSQTE